MHQSMNRAQLQVWIVTALLAPLAHGCGAGWMAALLAAGLFLPLAFLPGSFEGLPRPILWAQWGSVVLAGAVLLPASGSYWPGRASETVVPLTLLALAALTRNESRSANVAGILGWTVGLMAAAAGVLAAKKIRFRWLGLELYPWRQSLLLPLLLPALQKVWRAPQKRTALWIAAAAVTLGILIQGNLSLPLALSQETPFYTMARSLRLGSLSRVEPLVSLMLTFSWYAAAQYLLMSAKALLVQAGIREKPALLYSASAMGLLIAAGVRDPMEAVLRIALILWIIVPAINFQNKSKKDENKG